MTVFYNFLMHLNIWQFFGCFWTDFEIFCFWKYLWTFGFLKELIPAFWSNKILWFLKFENTYFWVILLKKQNLKIQFFIKGHNSRISLKPILRPLKAPLSESTHTFQDTIHEGQTPLLPKREQPPLRPFSRQPAGLQVKGR